MKNFKIFFISLLGILLLSSCELWKTAVIPPDECFEINGRTITKYDFENENCPTSIVIPEKINGEVIAEIWSRAFSPNIDNEFLTKIMKEDKEFGEIIKKVLTTTEATESEKRQFSRGLKSRLNTRMLTSIELSNNIEVIQKEAFAFNNLKFVKFGKNIQKIYPTSFAGNDLSEIVFTEIEKPVRIGEWAFQFNNLQRVILPKNSRYDDGAFDSSVVVEYTST